MTDKKRFLWSLLVVCLCVAACAAAVLLTAGS